MTTKNEQQKENKMTNKLLATFLIGCSLFLLAGFLLGGAVTNKDIYHDISKNIDYCEEQGLTATIHEYQGDYYMECGEEKPEAYLYTRWE